MKTIIYNALIVNEGRRSHGYVVIDGKFIEKMGEGTPATAEMHRCGKQIDAQQMLLLPGAIDDQVHFRDPGLTHKGDIATESRAAIAGGVTSYMDMPNTVPQTVTIDAWQAKMEHAAQVSAANYSFYMGATNSNIDEIAKADFTTSCGVKVFLGSSTGNMLVDNRETLRRIFSEIPALIAIHSEDEAIIARNKSYYRSRFGEDLPLCFHPLIRSAEACYASTARAMELATQCGTRLHVLHLSTARELQLLSDAPLAEKRITAEVCVHHLWFNDNDYSRYGNRIKCNPAIKTYGDRAALRQAVNTGLLDVVATDHAPHTLAEKQGSCLRAASGAPLVQFSLVAMLEMAAQGIFTIEKVVEKMCHAPAELYHIDRRGFLRPGYYADLVLVSPDAHNLVTDAQVVSRCGWTPFAGITFSHRVAATYVNGALAYDHGTFSDNLHGEKLRFNLS